MFFIFLAFAIPISIIDIRTRRIPDILNGACFLLVLLARLCTDPQALHLSLAAALFGFLLFFCVRLGTRGLGFGDVKFAAVIGLVCGFPGLLAAFFIAALLGIITALFFLLNDPKSKNAPLPFAPFLCAAVVITLGISPFFANFFTFFAAD
ncbi:hypothetical protein FACS1894130_12680 [Spirochaetia bacterium]|nr:hypothetical protein FACS1894130_12680 [Spirochaetia bacterium]